MQWNGAGEGVFGGFQHWADRYFHTTRPEDRRGLESEGFELASERRRALAELIVSDPQQAILEAAPEGVRTWLPKRIGNLLEQRVDGRGDLGVLAVLDRSGDESSLPTVIRRATIEGVSYEAYVFGGRLNAPTRSNIPLHGIALDGLLAVDDQPIRFLAGTVAESLQSGGQVPYGSASGRPSLSCGTPVAANIDGSTILLCCAEHAEELNEQLRRVEAYGDENAGSSTAVPGTNTWTKGQKKLLVIRVDFADLSGDPWSDLDGTNLIAGLDAFYREMSCQQTSFASLDSGSHVTSTLRLPRMAAWYAANNSYWQLRQDARSAAIAAGYALEEHELDIVAFQKVPGWNWEGLGYVGAPGVWLNGRFDVGVVAHELGHNFGLSHASFWETDGQSVIGPGYKMEYGDIFDAMGAASAGNHHFNAFSKVRLGWLTAQDYLIATNSGVYRIYAHDDTHSTGVRALMISKNTGTNYWVEFRQKFTNNPALMSGAGLRWEWTASGRSLLLDTTPGTPAGRDDSALVIGRTFSDWADGLHITPVGKGGTVPESLDVVVNRGPFPDNLPPQVSLSSTGTQCATGGTMRFTATASDPNGDSLAYDWDFGDGRFGSNFPTAGADWPVEGEYLVRCRVTDMKGGTASASMVVTVGSPETYRISGRVISGSQPVEGARVHVNTGQCTFTDSDGSYTLTGLTNGSCFVFASLEGHQFELSDVVMPLTVGPSRTGIDFYDTASTASPPVLLTPHLSASGIELVWTAIPGKRYRVQFSESANIPTWLDLGAEVTAQGSTARYLASRNLTAGFFRIVLLD